MHSSRSNIVRKSDTGIWMRMGLDRAAFHAIDLRTHFGMLLDRSVSVRDFRQWFVNSQWNIELEGDDDTVDLMSLIELRLAELTSGYISEDCLIETLQADLARRAGSSTMHTASFDFTSDSAGVTVWSVRDLFPLQVDRRLVVEFATAPAH